MLKVFPVLLVFLFFMLSRSNAQTTDPWCATSGGQLAVGPLGTGLTPPPSGPLYLRIYVYKLGDANGLHMPTDEQIHKSIAILRSAYNEHNIFFVWDCGIEEIKSDELDKLAFPYLFKMLRFIPKHVKQ